MGSVSKMNKQEKANETTIHLRGWSLTYTVSSGRYPVLNDLFLKCGKGRTMTSQRGYLADSNATSDEVNTSCKSCWQHAPLTRDDTCDKKGTSHLKPKAPVQSREIFETNPNWEKFYKISDKSSLKLSRSSKTRSETSSKTRSETCHSQGA